MPLGTIPVHRIIAMLCDPNTKIYKINSAWQVINNDGAADGLLCLYRIIACWHWWMTYKENGAINSILCLLFKLKLRRKLYGKSWWRHQMETFSALLAIGAGNSMVTGEFPAQWPATRSFDVFCDLCLNKRLRERHHAHFDVIVMCWG